MLGTSTTLEDSYTYSLLSPDTNYIAIVKSIRAGYESLPVSQAFRTPGLITFELLKQVIDY